MSKDRIENPGSEPDFNLPDENEMQGIWDNIEPLKERYPKPDTNKMLKGVSRKLGWQQVNQPEKRFKYFFIRNAAAVLLLITVLGVGIYYSIDVIRANKNYITFVSEKGTRTQLELPDGSTLWLQPNATVKYPENFEENSREILFSGQGYFDIKTEPDKPFTVKIGKTSITVLGTRFYVKAKDKTGIVETGLIAGSVQVSNPTQEVTLAPGDIVVLSNETNQIVERKNISSLPFSWSDNRMVFDNCSFETIIKELSSWYGFDYHMDPQLDLTTKVTLTIKDESLDEITEILKIVVPFEYEIFGNRIIYTSRQ
jgi:ferric-dicitrate binding protein FerR (iron transport regulator)